MYFILYFIQQMKTNKENVFGAGDVTEFPLFLADDARTNIQHWQMAQQHGLITLNTCLFNFITNYLLHK